MSNEQTESLKKPIAMRERCISCVDIKTDAPLRVKAEVDDSALGEALAKANELYRLLKEANSLADELASKFRDIDVNVAYS